MTPKQLDGSNGNLLSKTLSQVKLNPVYMEWKINYSNMTETVNRMQWCITIYAHNWCHTSHSFVRAASFKRSYRNGSQKHSIKIMNSDS